MSEVRKVVLFVAVFGFLIITANLLHAAPGDTLRVTSWEWAEFDSSIPLEDALSRRNVFSPYAGEVLSRSVLDSSNKLIFITSLLVPPEFGGKEIAFLIGPGSYPLELYLNGHLVAKLGNIGDPYGSTIYYATRVPAGIHGTGEPLELVIVAHPRSEINPLPLFLYGDWLSISRDVFFRNLFNVNLIQAAVLLSFIIAIFFMVLFFTSGNKELSYLMFAFVCISFSLGYLNMSLFHEGVNELFLEKISRIGLPLTSLFCVYFVMVFTKFSLGTKRRDQIFITVSGVLTGLVCLGTLLQPNKPSLVRFFALITTNVVLTPMLIATIVILVWGVVKKPDIRRVAVLAAFGLTISASLHDIMWLGSPVPPYAWLVPYGYLMLVLSIFFVLALDQASVLAKSNIQALALKEQHLALSEVVGDLAQVSDGLVTSSEVLEFTVSETLGTIEKYGNENKQLSEIFSSRSLEIGETLGAVSSHLENSSNRVSTAVTNQTEAVREVGGSLESIKNRVRESLLLANKSTELAEELRTAAGNGAAAMEKSRGAVRRVSESSVVIKDVLGTISDIVERTNILAINAAIESARVGVAGRGFAVVAGEIKTLAKKSAQSLDESFQRIKEMTDAIDENVDAENAVDSAIEQIRERAERSVTESESMRRVMIAQGEASEVISTSAARLQDETSALERISRGEQQVYRELGLKLEEIRAGFTELSSRIEAQGGMTSGLGSALQRIRNVLDDNSRHIEQLKHSFDLAQKATKTIGV